MAERHDSLREACKEFEQDLILYYYQDCGGAERGKLESHLERCALCRRFLEELRKLLPMAVKADEPSPAFWQSYTQEMLRKLAGAEQKADWWQRSSFIFRLWPVPALATALILALALTLNLTKEPWRSHQPQEKELVEMVSVTGNLEFFESLDFLDSMDLLEAIEGKETHKSEPSH